MRPLSLLLCGLALLVVPRELSAEQEVTLKSGAMVVGDVAFEDGVLIVTMEEDQVRIPLGEVATIASVESSRERRARHLLILALEARLLSDTGEQVIGLLAEAARLAPDDPHVAYWHASSLADAGHGTAARDVLQRQRNEIAKAFPGLVDELARQIDRRIQLQQLPDQMVERIDAFNELAAGRIPLDSQERRMMAALRVVDQSDVAIPSSAFEINCSGFQETIESFDDGYFLFAYKEHGRNSGQACRLVIAEPGLEPKQVQFFASARDVVDVSTFVVHRFDESDKIPFRAQIVHQDDSPIVGAQITLRPVRNRSGSGAGLSTESDEDGRGQLLAFPMQYFYQVSADGFKGETGRVTLTAGEGEEEKSIVLYPLVQAAVRVMWASTAANFNGELDAGETILETAAGNQNAQQLPWLQLVQDKDQLKVHIQSQFFGRPNQPGAWVRMMKADQERDIAPLLVYKNLELYDIDGLKDELPPVADQQPGMARGNMPIVLPAELGKVYVGKVSRMDQRTGQPMQVAFKAIIEKLQVAADE